MKLFKLKPLAVCALVVLAASIGFHARAETIDPPGEITVIGEPLAHGQPGELVLRYQAGAGGIPEGYSLWVQLPAGWQNKLGCINMSQYLAWQSKDSDRDGYFDVSDAPTGVRIEREVGGRADILGLENRYVTVFSFTVRGRDLDEGDSFEMSFANIIKDGEAHAPTVGGFGPIRWLVVSPEEPLPKGRFLGANFSAGEPRPYEPAETWLEVKAGPPERVIVTLPSIATTGERVSAKVRVFDRYYNLAEGSFNASLILSDRAGHPLFNRRVGWTGGLGSVDLVMSHTGIFLATVEVQGVGKASSNPISVVDRPKDRIYWGDPHSHSQWSHDGVGVNILEYARDAAALDFHAVTEHNYAIIEEEWETIVDQNETNNQPGRFVTLPAMENSSYNPSGHFNLYFEEPRPEVVFGEQLDDAWEIYGHYDPIIIQHHTGISWGGGMPQLAWAARLLGRYIGPHVDWREYRDVPRQAVEIYSQHGQSEMYDPEDPLAYENCDMRLPEHDDEKGPCTTGSSMKGPHYVRDAWAAGLVMGTVAGSDDHRAQPGKPGGGLTAVIAPELTRKAILGAIRARSVYATTGDRVILDFAINGQPMGSAIDPAPDGDITVEVHAAAGRAIALVQVMRYDWESGKWKAVIDESPGELEVSLSRELESVAPAVYYLRLEQDGLTSGRVSRAWSSPIWVGEPPSD